MKKLLCLLAVIGSFVLMDDISAKEVTKENVKNGTYVIGNYTFDRTQTDNYDGTLTIEHIMLAAKSIGSDSLDSMKIYYKNARGKWVNPINNKELTNNEVPTKFDVNYTNLDIIDLDLQAPDFHMKDLDESINDKDVPGCVANDDNTLTCHFELDLSKYKNEQFFNSAVKEEIEFGYEIYAKYQDVEPILKFTGNLVESSKISFSDIYHVNSGAAKYFARVYIENVNGEKVYSDDTQPIEINVNVENIIVEKSTIGTDWNYENTGSIAQLKRYPSQIEFDYVDIYRSLEEDGEYELAHTFYNDIDVMGSGTGMVIPAAILNPMESYYYKAKTIKFINGRKFESEFSPIYHESYNLVPDDATYIGANFYGAIGGKYKDYDSRSILYYRPTTSVNPDGAHIYKIYATVLLDNHIIYGDVLVGSVAAQDNDELETKTKEFRLNFASGQPIWLYDEVTEEEYFAVKLTLHDDATFDYITIVDSQLNVLASLAGPSLTVADNYKYILSEDKAGNVAIYIRNGQLVTEVK